MSLAALVHSAHLSSQAHGERKFKSSGSANHGEFFQPEGDKNSRNFVLSHAGILQNYICKNVVNVCARGCDCCLEGDCRPWICCLSISDWSYNCEWMLSWWMKIDYAVEYGFFKTVGAMIL